MKIAITDLGSFRGSNNIRSMHRHPRHDRGDWSHTASRHAFSTRLATPPRDICAARSRVFSPRIIVADPRRRHGRGPDPAIQSAKPPIAMPAGPGVSDAGGRLQLKARQPLRRDPDSPALSSATVKVARARDAQAPQDSKNETRERPGRRVFRTKAIAASTDRSAPAPRTHETSSPATPPSFASVHVATTAPATGMQALCGQEDGSGDKFILS